MRSKLNRQKAFSKVEFLVFIAIVITLVTTFLVFILDAQRSIRDAVRRGDIESISRELEVHFNRQPNQFCATDNVDSYCQPQASWFTNQKLPHDPLGPDYFNLPQNGDKKYLICAKLEKSSGNAGGLDGKPGAGGEHYYCQQNQQ